MDPVRKRILFIMPLPPPVHGSAMVSRQIRDSQLINESFDCDYINLSTSKKMTEVGKNNPVKILRFVSSFSILLWKLATRKYDLCYLALTCHGRGFLKDAPFALLCKLFRRKLVLHQHNKGMDRDVDRWPYRFLFPLVYNKTKVILLSRFLYQDISRIVPEENVLVCPNGIQDFAVTTKQESELKQTVRIVFISNLIKSKGVLDLIEACRLLKERNEAFLCDIIGNETCELNRQDIERIISDKGLEDFVVYNGALYGEDKEKALHNADIFVFPTYYSDECFPLCILEAMRHALPVVTTDEGGIRDMVTDGFNGIICKKGDPPSVAHAISRLIENPENRLDMGQNGRERFESDFTLDCFEKDLIDCLNKAAN